MLRAAHTTWRTDTGRQRRGNEDSAFARAPLFVIADGMGGAQAGEVASQIAVEAFQDELPERGTPEEKLAGVAQVANRRIYDISRSEHERAGMGTTLTAVYVRGQPARDRARRRQPRLPVPRRRARPADPGPHARRRARQARQADRGAGGRASAALDHHTRARDRRRGRGRHLDLRRARRRRRAAVQRRADVDDHRGADRRGPVERARSRRRGRPPDRRGQRGRRARQHHRDPVHARGGGRRRATSTSRR